MISRTRSKVRLLSLLAAPALALGVSACGSSEPAANLAVNGSIPGGSTAGTVSPSTCSGSTVTLNGVQVCKTVQYLVGGSIYGYNTFAYSCNAPVPILNPDNPQAPWGCTSAVEVRPNDTVSVSSTGYWGTRDVSTSSYLGGLLNISTSSWDCDKFNSRGYSGGTLHTSDGYPVGLLLSDGSQVYSTNSGKVVIQNAGQLRFGINIPYGSSGLCHSVNFTQLKVTRCQDSSGNTYACQ
jgi:hypothetical protein